MNQHVYQAKSIVRPMRPAARLAACHSSATDAHVAEIRGSGTSFQRRIYTREFKNQAADLVLRQGYTVMQAARQLGISHKTLNNWIRPQRKIKTRPDDCRRSGA